MNASIEDVKTKQNLYHFTGSPEAVKEWLEYQIPNLPLPESLAGLDVVHDGVYRVVVLGDEPEAIEVASEPAAEPKRRVKVAE